MLGCEPTSASKLACKISLAYLACLDAERLRKAEKACRAFVSSPQTCRSLSASVTASVHTLCHCPR